MHLFISVYRRKRRLAPIGCALTIKKSHCLYNTKCLTRVITHSCLMIHKGSQSEVAGTILSGSRPQRRTGSSNFSNPNRWLIWTHHRWPLILDLYVVLSCLSSGNMSWGHQCCHIDGTFPKLNLQEAFWPFETSLIPSSFRRQLQRLYRNFVLKGRGSSNVQVWRGLHPTASMCTLLYVDTAMCPKVNILCRCYFW